MKKEKEDHERGPKTTTHFCRKPKKSVKSRISGRPKKQGVIVVKAEQHVQTSDAKPQDLPKRPPPKDRSAIPLSKAPNTAFKERKKPGPKPMTAQEKRKREEERKNKPKAGRKRIYEGPANQLKKKNRKRAVIQPNVETATKIIDALKSIADRNIEMITFSKHCNAVLKAMGKTVADTQRKALNEAVKVLKKTDQKFKQEFDNILKPSAATLKRRATNATKKLSAKKEFA